MQEEKEIFSCPVEATLSLIGGKYKPLILWHLIEQPLHYMELQRTYPKSHGKNAFPAAPRLTAKWFGIKGSDTREPT